MVKSACLTGVYKEITVLIRIENWPKKAYKDQITVTVRPFKDEAEKLDYWQQSLAEAIRRACVSSVHLNDRGGEVVPVFGGRQVLEDCTTVVIVLDGGSHFAISSLAAFQTVAENLFEAVHRFLPDEWMVQVFYNDRLNADHTLPLIFQKKTKHNSTD